MKNIESKDFNHLDLIKLILPVYKPGENEVVPEVREYLDGYLVSLPLGERWHTEGVTDEGRQSQKH